MKILVNEKLSTHRYKTPEGYLICTDAILARTGKQKYSRNELFNDGDSTEVEVDRPYNQVMNAKTIASFENKPVTFDHPDEDVNIGNYKDYAIGYVRDVRQGKTEKGENVIIGDLVITDQDAINAIESGDHTDLSCGYDCDIIEDGNGGYMQTNIRGNHVALCEQGRAGIARIVDSKMKDENLLETIDRLQASSGVRNYTMKEGKNKNNGHHIIQYIFDRNNLIVYDKNKDEIIGLIENGKTKINKLHDAIIDNEIVDSIKDARIEGVSPELLLTANEWLEDKLYIERKYHVKIYNITSNKGLTVTGSRQDLEKLYKDYHLENDYGVKIVDSKVRDWTPEEVKEFKVERHGRGYGVYYKGQLVSKYDDYDEDEVEEELKRLRRYYYVDSRIGDSGYTYKGYDLIDFGNVIAVQKDGRTLVKCPTEEEAEEWVDDHISAFGDSKDEKGMENMNIKVKDLDNTLKKLMKELISNGANEELIYDISYWDGGKDWAVIDTEPDYVRKLMDIAKGRLRLFASSGRNYVMINIGYNGKFLDSKIEDDYSIKEIKEAAKKLLQQKPFLSYEEALQKVKENIKNGNYLLDNEIEDANWYVIFESRIGSYYTGNGWTSSSSNAKKYTSLEKAKQAIIDYGITNNSQLIIIDNNGKTCAETIRGRLKSYDNKIEDTDEWIIKNTGLDYEVWNGGKLIKKFATKRQAIEWIQDRFPNDEITDSRIKKVKDSTAYFDKDVIGRNELSEAAERFGLKYMESFDQHRVEGPLNKIQQLLRYLNINENSIEINDSKMKDAYYEMGKMGIDEDELKIDCGNLGLKCYNEGKYYKIEGNKGKIATLLSQYNMKSDWTNIRDTNSSYRGYELVYTKSEWQVWKNGKLLIKTPTDREAIKWIDDRINNGVKDSIKIAIKAINKLKRNKK